MFYVEIAIKSFYFSSTMSPEQSRAARGWLGWSQADLATKAKVSLSTVRDFERGRHVPIAVTLDAMRRALGTAGIEFIDESGKPAGIRVARNAREASD